MTNVLLLTSHTTKEKNSKNRGSNMPTEKINKKITDTHTQTDKGQTKDCEHSLPAQPAVISNPYDV